MTPTRWFLIAAAVGLFVVGLFVGRASIPVIGDFTVDSLRITAIAHDSARKAIRHFADSTQTEHEQDSTTAANAVRSSGVSRRRAATAEAEADSLHAELATVQTAADSVPLLVREIGSIRFALSEKKQEADSLEAARQNAEKRFNERGAVILGLQSQVTRDSVRLVQYDETVTRLTRVAKGCRIPIVGLKCPVVGPGYAGVLSNGGVSHGIAVAAIIPLF